MDEFEVAVLLSMDPVSNPGRHHQAMEFVRQVEAAPDGWRFCLERLSQDGYRPETRFWCLELLLRTVRRAGGPISPESRQVVRSSLVPLLQALAGSSGMPSYVTNKAAQLFTAIVGLDYPTVWPQAFQEGVMSLPGLQPSGIDVFFSVLQAVDEDLTSKRAAELDGARAIRVKDAMREDCIAQLMATVASLLAGGQTRAVALAFDAIKRYAEWVDIQLVVTSAFIDTVHAVFRGSPEDVSRFVSSASSAMRAVLAKGMPADHKQKLMVLMRVRDLFVAPVAQGRLSGEIAEEEEDLNLAPPEVEYARLINQVAMEAIECLKSGVAGEVSSIAEAALPAALRLVGDDDAGVTAETLEFVNVYIRMCRSNAQQHVPGLYAALQVIVERGCFPEGFDPMDNLSPFNNMRRNLFTMFKNIARAVPEMAISAVQTLFQEEMQNRNQRPARIELALTLLNLCQEVLATSDNAELDKTLVVVLSSSVPCMQVEAVGTSNNIEETHRTFAFFALFTLAYHAHKVITMNAHMLPTVLASFFDERGLQHPSSSFHRSRTSDLLLKFFTKLKAVIAERYLQELVGTMTALLTGAHNLTPEDHLNMYEALGIVIGFTSANVAPNRAEVLRVVLHPLIDMMRSAVTTGDVSSGVVAAAAAANVAKGFTSPLSDAVPEGRQLADLWISCLEAILALYAAEPANEEVNLRIITFTQTILEPLGQTVLPYVQRVVPQLLRTTTSPVDLTRVLELLNQVAAHFREKSFDTMNAVYAPTLKRTFDFPPRDAANNGASEEVRERQELRKTFLNMLHSTLVRHLHKVLISPENISTLEATVGMVVDGAMGTNFDLNSAPIVMKQCMQLLERMTSFWLQALPSESAPQAQNDDSVELEGFRQFVLERMPAICISSAKESHFIVTRGYELALSEKILLEDLNLLKTAFSRCGKDFGRQFDSELVLKFGCPQPVAQEFIVLLVRADSRTLLRPFISLLQRLGRKV